MAEPICVDNCTDALSALPDFDFSECAPQVNAGEVRRIFLGIPGNPFADWKIGTEWAARLLASNVGPTKIVALTVMGDKPRPTSQTRDISGGRKQTLSRDHVLNASADETSQANHDAFRQMECGGTYIMWYETSGGLMFGGNAGIRVNFDPGMVIPRDKAGTITWELTGTWTSKFTEERTVSPIF